MTTQLRNRGDLVIEHEDLGPMLSPDDMALLLGVPVGELKAAVMVQTTGNGTQTVRLPRAWREQGRSRTDIYRQATGRDDMAGALAFWRAQRKTSEGDTTQ